MNTTDIQLHFKSTDGELVALSPIDLTEIGTPIDENGNELEYIGWSLADSQTYTLAEIRNGTGFPKDIRFQIV